MHTMATYNKNHFFKDIDLILKDQKKYSVTTPKWITDTETTTHVITFPTQRTLTPALEPEVELGLTCTYIALYGILFLVVYGQLWMILYYKHKRFSYQTVFLYIVLIWSGLRMTLFSFYFNDCKTVNLFQFFPYWLLFSFPVCLQFVIICLMVHYFAQVIFRARSKYVSSKWQKLVVKVCLSLAVLIFLITNIVCAALYKGHYHQSNHPYVTYARVAVCDTLFILMGVILSVCIYKMRKIQISSILEARGTTVCQSLVACVLIVLLYLSRAVYNIIAVCPRNRNKAIPTFGFDWINVTDQADFVELDKGYAYLSFAIVLFVWEVLPMFVVVFFFRVRKPTRLQEFEDLVSQSHESNSFFFNNPRRYDSDDDLDENTDPKASINNTDHYSTDSPPGTPIRTQKLGYGAVTSTDHTYIYSVSS